MTAPRQGITYQVSRNTQHATRNTQHFPPRPLPPRSRYFSWILLVAWWTLYGVLHATQNYVIMQDVGRPTAFLEIADSSMVSAYTWIPISLALIWLVRRFPIEQGRLLVSVPVLLGASAALAYARCVAVAQLGQWFAWYPAIPLRRLLVTQFFLYNIFCWAIIGFAHALDYYRRYRDRELRAARLEARLADARLQLLKMQLHPHFLFNTLHAISTLMHRDVRTANRMVARLSDLLRVALAHQTTHEVTLREELASLEPYVEIERTRFGERLTVAIDVDAELLDAQVPHLILQPLVENAIRHGVSRRAGLGRVDVRARRRDAATLELEVRDDGAGPPETPNGGRGGRQGVGLANTRARLEQLYGERQAFSFVHVRGEGTTVRLAIPYHIEAPGEGSDASALVRTGDWVAPRTNAVVTK